MNQGNYTEFRDFIKTKMEEDKVEDEAVEICFRVARTVEMVEFTTPARKKTALEAEENFVKATQTRVDMADGLPNGTPPQVRCHSTYPSSYSYPSSPSDREEQGGEQAGR